MIGSAEMWCGEAMETDSRCASREGNGGRKRRVAVEGVNDVLGKAGEGGLFSSSVGTEGFLLVHTHFSISV